MSGKRFLGSAVRINMSVMAAALLPSVACSGGDGAATLDAQTESAPSPGPANTEGNNEDPSGDDSVSNSVVSAGGMASTMDMTQPDSQGGQARSQGGAENSAGAAGAESDPPIASVPSWTLDVLPIFRASCGDNNVACHAEAAYVGWPQSDCRGWLSLVDAPLGSTFMGEYRNGEKNGCPDFPLPERLLMQPWQCDSGRYVEPGDAEASYLYRKIAGGPYCDLEEGPSEAMPMVGQLPAEDIATIRDWINAGAPFDN